MFSFRQAEAPSIESTTATSDTPNADSIASVTVTAAPTNATSTSAINSSLAADKPMTKSRHLQDIENTEQDMTLSLQKQLQHVRETTASLKENSPDFKPDIQAVLQSSDPELIKTALLEALENQKDHEVTIKKLRHEVDVERGHATILRHDNQVLRQMKANMHAVAEQEEENISNRLLKRISGLKKEKGELMLQVEQEEEYLTKTLQKKLSQLQKEKIDMENALEQEQEYIVNRLQKQLDAMRLEQSANTSAASSWQDKDLTVGSGLPVGSSPINIAGGGRSSRIHPNPSPTPSPTHKKWIPSHSPSSSDHGPSHPVVDMLKAELTAAKATLNELEREYLVKFKQCNRYRSEVLALRQEYGLPVASDLLVEDNLPAVLSSTHRSGGTPSRRNSSTSVSGSSRISHGVPATPTNTPANPAPINNQSFSGQRTSLSPHNVQPNPFVGTSGIFNHLSTSPTLAAFPGGMSGNSGPGLYPSNAHSQPYSYNNSGTNSFSSSVGSLGSTSPMMSMSSSLSSTSGLPAIVPERQSLYRSKSSSRQPPYMPNQSYHQVTHQMQLQQQLQSQSQQSQPQQDSGAPQ
ncbi:hypothetical protein BGZ76_003306 [Entomortierella beljakovae]|nr:hypothetical protein BGZ76_003306 [Entomortierella beljakovae]